ncbi:MAG: hypothetical protein ACTS27_06000 [Phycisphaerales bacterium]
MRMVGIVRAVAAPCLVLMAADGRAQTCVPEIATEFTPVGLFGNDLAQGGGRLAFMDSGVTGVRPGFAAVRLYDITNPDSPTLLADIPAAPLLGSIIFPTTLIEIDGDVLWRYTTNTRELVGTDISDPANVPDPATWPSFTLSEVPTFGAPDPNLFDIVARSGRLYIYRSPGQVFIYDISNPNAVQYLGNFTYSNVGGDSAFLVFSDGLLYVSLSNNSPANKRLDIWDLADGVNPQRISMTPIEDLVRVRAVGNGVALLEGFRSAEQQTFYFLADVSDPAAPVVLGEVPGQPFSIFGFASIIRDQRLYLFGNFGCEMAQYAAYDLDDPAAPQRVSLPVRFEQPTGYVLSRLVEGAPVVFRPNGTVQQRILVFDELCAESSLAIYDAILLESTTIFDGAPELQGVPLAQANILIGLVEQQLSNGFLAVPPCDPITVAFAPDSTVGSVLVQSSTALFDGSTTVGAVIAENATVEVVGHLMTGILDANATALWVNGLLTAGDISLTDGSVLRHSDAAVTEIVDPRSKEGTEIP